MSPLFLLAGFFIVAILMSLVLAYTKGSIVLKLTTVGVLFALTVGIMFTFEAYKGWPSTEIPNNGQIVGISIEKDVAFYLWIDEEDTLRPEYWYDFLRFREEGPRVYRLPYDEDKLAEYTEAQRKLNDGYYVRGVFDALSISEGGVEGYSIGPEIEIISPDQLLTK